MAHRHGHGDIGRWRRIRPKPRLAVPSRSGQAEVTSESDDRGLLGDADAPAGPLTILLEVRMEAEGRSRAELEAIIERALRRSPVSDAARRETPVEVRLA